MNIFKILKFKTTVMLMTVFVLFITTCSATDIRRVIDGKKNFEFNGLNLNYLDSNDIKKSVGEILYFNQQRTYIKLKNNSKEIKFLVIDQNITHKGKRNCQYLLETASTKNRKKHATIEVINYKGIPAFIKVHLFEDIHCEKMFSYCCFTGSLSLVNKRGSEKIFMMSNSKLNCFQVATLVLAYEQLNEK